MGIIHGTNSGWLLWRLQGHVVRIQEETNVLRCGRLSCRHHLLMGFSMIYRYTRGRNDSGSMGLFISWGLTPKKNCDVISKLIWTKYIMAIGQPCGCPLLVLNRSEKHDPNSVDLSGTCLGPETWREAEFGMNENLPNTYRRPWDYLSHPPSRKMNIYSEMMFNKYIYIYHK